MTMRALDRKLWRDLAAIKGQAAAIALVIGCGVAAFVMALTVLVSLKHTRERYYEQQQFADVFAPLKRAPDKIADRVAEIPGVARVHPRVQALVTLDIPEVTEVVSGLLLSVPEQSGAGLNQLYLRRGRWPDLESQGEVLVSEAFANARQLRPGDSLNAVIHGRRRALRVSGTVLSPEFIYEIRPGELLPDPKSFGVLWMGHRELAQLAGMEGAFNEVSMTLSRGASVPAVLQRVDSLLAPWGGTGAHDREDQLSHRMVSDEFDQLRGMAVITPGIFLAVAAFLLNVVLARLISTQREQIAAIRAFGYTGREIGWHYAKLAGVVTLLGVVIGGAAGGRLGYGMTVMYAKFFQFPILHYRFEPWVVALAAMVSLTATALGVRSAVRQAARLPPAEAMRPEAPANFRASLIERVPALRRLRQGGRMMLRNLARKPARTCLGVTGIGLALAVLIVGSFTGDVVNEIINRQFQVAQRQDYTITLTEPAGPAVLRDIRELPGVRRAEPFRVIPVRLRHGWRSKETGLTGYSEDRIIHPVLDMELNPVPLDRPGLALSESLAAALDARPGDRIGVEVLEGRRRVTTATVSALVNDSSGLAAFTTLEEAWRLLGEGPTLSGAFVTADPADGARLHNAIKNAPRIAAINSRHAMLRSFRDTLAENLLRMKFFNVLFAGIIAFGVVFNVARIAVAERGREFATLRVLGFTRAEVSRLMLGEIALVTAAGIPMGLLLGRLFAGWVADALATESLRLPLVIYPSTYAFSILVIAAAALISALAARHRLDHLDLIGVLKARD
jgi:putative ABC transport system permease protein